MVPPIRFDGDPKKPEQSYFSSFFEIVNYFLSLNYSAGVHIHTHIFECHQHP